MLLRTRPTQETPVRVIGLFRLAVTDGTKAEASVTNWRITTPNEQTVDMKFGMLLQPDVCACAD